ncbi:MAG: NifB/NifX family molybdenum-iron cluster-binding protein [Limnochordia bacterium]|jgi:predicted Fe-Mo cluster-binding NifX family protein|nr:NifB/NifX family molybdenum-iron cluster-binding protein [Limnochordia bacterium]
MKIAIPVDEKDLRTNVCASFGRAAYFLIYETETKTSVFIDNSSLASPGGAGIKAAQTLIDNQVSALLTPRCGENAAKTLESAGIKIFKTTSVSVRENLADSRDGKLPLLEDIHAGFHGHGGD